MSIGLEHYLILSAALFSIGLYGALAKRNAIVILMSIEIMLNAVNIAMVAFSRYIVPLRLEDGMVVGGTGQVFTIFIIIVAAAEAAVGLAIIMTIYRTRETVDATKIDLMKR
jgi:NAD(P)H-quinone oxidoreductase subunit 4L